MKKILGAAGLIAAALLVNVSSSTPYAQPYHRQAPEFGNPPSVICCCPTGNGGSCCAEADICSSIVPGCMCSYR